MAAGAVLLAAFLAAFLGVLHRFLAVRHASLFPVLLGGLLALLLVLHRFLAVLLAAEDTLKSTYDR